MKTLTASVIAAFLAIISIHTQAQTTASLNDKESKTEKREARKELNKQRESEVSFMAKNNFLVDFDKASDVKWVKGPEFDEATFTKDGQKLTAYYDYKSILVGTTSNKKFSDLPASAQKEIQKEYKGYVTGAVILYDDNGSNETNMYLYGHGFDDADHYFVTVSKGTKEIVLMVSTDGQVSYFRHVS